MLIISAELAQALMSYLEKMPYRDVVALIMQLRNLKEAEKQNG